MAKKSQMQNRVKAQGQQTETVEGVVDINPTVLISTSIINCLKTNERQTQ